MVTNIIQISQSHKMNTMERIGRFNILSPQIDFLQVSYSIKNNFL